uniref:Putative secreted protein n=1 Tax=Anopheles marajoara TaxID=58244 RepID=A0A2M4CAX3_9DIPT
MRSSRASSLMFILMFSLRTDFSPQPQDAHRRAACTTDVHTSQHQWGKWAKPYSRRTAFAAAVHQRELLLTHMEQRKKATNCIK